MTTKNDSSPAGSRGFPPWLTEDRLAEMDRLISRLTLARTHYQALGLDSDARDVDIRRAFLLAVDALFPPYTVAERVPLELEGAAQEAFERVTKAFVVLNNPRRRASYNRELASVSKPVNDTADSRFEIVPDPAPPEEPEEIRAAARREGVVYSETRKGDSGSSRRRAERLDLRLPVRAIGHERTTGKWVETAHTTAVSRTGLTLALRRRVRVGSVLFLSLPMPMKLRSHGYSDPAYSTYGIVRRVDPPVVGTTRESAGADVSTARGSGRVSLPETAVRTVGVELLGQHPPPGYLEKPWAVFRTKAWKGPDRRRAPREKTSELFSVEYLNEAGQCVGRETCRAEDISDWGVRLVARVAPLEIEMMRVRGSRRKFDRVGVAADRFVGKDGFQRICVRFID